MMYALLGGVGKVIDIVLSNLICALIGCSPDAAFYRCQRCGWRL